jgi:hypothetical protein
MRAITNIATTMPVTRPALQRELLHRAAARLAPMTKGARKAARTRKRFRFRRSQAWVRSSYILAALSPAFPDLRACSMPTSMSSMRVLCGRNSQSGAEHAGRGRRSWGPGSARKCPVVPADGGCLWGIRAEVVAVQAFPLVTGLQPWDCKSIAKASKVRILHLPPRAERAPDLRKRRTGALLCTRRGYPKRGG